MDIIRKVKNAIVSGRLINKGELVIAGVSGGPDSVTLLYLLSELRHQLGFRIHVAHVNHGLRRSANHDQQFVESLANRLTIPLTSSKIKIRRSKQKSSIEEIAREARIDFFIGLVRKLSADAVALGHTQDDLAETVIMRILRGTGLSGLRGILPSRMIHSVRFIRPLLEIERRDVETFLRKNRIPSCQDPTNKDQKFSRNKIRLELLPYLKQFNPNIKTALAHLSHSCTADYDYFESQGRDLLRKLGGKSKRSVISFKVQDLKPLHPGLLRMMIRMAIEELKGNTNRLTFLHIKDIEDLISSQVNNKTLHLPSGIYLQKNGKFLSLSFKKDLIKSRVKL